MTIREEIQKGKSLETTLIINKDHNESMEDALSNLYNAEAPESYKQLQFKVMSHCTIDLARFTKLEFLYFYGARHVALENVPASVKTICFSRMGIETKIPYLPTLDRLIRLSDQMLCYSDLTKLYHKYRLHHFDYARVLGAPFPSLYPDYQYLEKEIVAELQRTGCRL